MRRKNNWTGWYAGFIDGELRYVARSKVTLRIHCCDVIQEVVIVSARKMRMHEKRETDTARLETVSGREIECSNVRSIL